MGETNPDFFCKIIEASENVGKRHGLGLESEIIKVSG